MYRTESVFEYQMQANSRTGSLKLVESRDARKEAFRDPSKTLLITNGFASMLLVLPSGFRAEFCVCARQRRSRRRPHPRQDSLQPVRARPRPAGHPAAKSQLPAAA